MKIHLSTSRWNGAKYTTATRHYHCQDETVNLSTWDSIVQWCEQHYGPMGDP